MVLIFLKIVLLEIFVILKNDIMQLICGVKESKKQFYFHFLNYLTNDLK